jgi:hypothetical protein
MADSLDRTVASNLKKAIAKRNRSGYDRASARQQIASFRIGEYAKTLKPAAVGMRGDPALSAKLAKSQKAADLTRRRAKKQYRAEGLTGPGPKPAGGGKYWVNRVPAGSPKGGQFKSKGK